MQKQCQKWFSKWTWKSEFTQSTEFKKPINECMRACDLAKCGRVWEKCDSKNKSIKIAITACNAYLFVKHCDATQNAVHMPYLMYGPLFDAKIIFQTLKIIRAEKLQCDFCIKWDSTVMQHKVFSAMKFHGKHGELREKSSR